MHTWSRGPASLFPAAAPAYPNSARPALPTVIFHTPRASRRSRTVPLRDCFHSATQRASPTGHCGPERRRERAQVDAVASLR